MSTVSAKDAKVANVGKMGQALGEQFSALWQELAGLHSRWGEFVDLYADKPSRIELMNRIAPAFFRFTQDAMMEQTVLHIARLIDPPYSAGDTKKTNLTLRGLPELISDATAKAEVSALIEDVTKKAEFAKQWRDKWLAHRDLRLSLEDNPHSAGLPEAEAKQITDVLASMAAVLNAVDRHFNDTSTLFDAGASVGGAETLLYHLSHAKHLQEVRLEKLARGEWSADDFEPDDY